MKRLMLIAAILAGFTFSLITQQTNASDWTGVYARIDRVIFEPNESAPERIQIWGAFALATKDSRNDYDPAQRGYLYYSLKPGKEEICRKEWADLKAVAGTGQIVGFGGRNQPAQLRKISDNPANPDVYPVDHGVSKVNDYRGDYAPIRDLKSIPKER
jgi:hypothetical protein